MAEKSVKKPVAKKAAVKKSVVKPAPAKKPVAKKAPAKKPVAKKVVAPVAPVVETHTCGCGADCKCHQKKRCGFWKKLLVAVIFFALGFAAAKFCPCAKKFHRGPRPVFDNGCLVVKCPKMAEMLPMMDVNNDGCVDKAEFKSARKHMKKPAPTPAPVEQPVEQPAEPVVAE